MRSRRTIPIALDANYSCLEAIQGSCRGRAFLHVRRYMVVFLLESGVAPAALMVAIDATMTAIEDHFSGRVDAKT